MREYINTDVDHISETGRYVLPICQQSDINLDMTTRRYSIPSISALVAFESTARHCHFSRAAEELHTSQSAISRHIGELESKLGVLLFDRSSQRIRLTMHGESLYNSVRNGLNTLQGGIREVSRDSAKTVLTIACSHEISHLFLMPKFDGLQDVLGDSVQIRILTYEYERIG